MMKPPNVKNIYPLRKAKSDFELPAYLENKELIVIFNIEAHRPDDLLYNKVYLNKLRIQIE